MRQAQEIMTAEAPFPITTELLSAQPVYKRAQAILSGWHRHLVKEGQLPEKKWHQDHLEALEMVAGKSQPGGADWYWTMERSLTAQQMLYQFVRCTYHEDPEERMEGWKALQHFVTLWDEKFANDTDVA